VLFDWTQCKKASYRGQSIPGVAARHTGRARTNGGNDTTGAIVTETIVVFAGLPPYNHRSE